VTKHAPNTLFKRHPLPWRISEASGDPCIISSAKNKLYVCEPTVEALLNVINAAAPLPFKPGWYWARYANGEMPIYLTSEKALAKHVNIGWAIGKFIGTGFEAADE